MSHSSTFTKLALFCILTNVDLDEIVAKFQTWSDKIVKKSIRMVGHTKLENKCDNNVVESSQNVY